MCKNKENLVIVRRYETSEKVFLIKVKRRKRLEKELPKVPENILKALPIVPNVPNHSVPESKNEKLKESSMIWESEESKASDDEPEDEPSFEEKFRKFIRNYQGKRRDLKKLYLCACGTSFALLSDLEKHLSCIRASNDVYHGVRCSQCRAKLTVRTVTAHLLLKHEIFICKFCFKQFLSKRGWKNHEQKQHHDSPSVKLTLPTGNFNCKICNVNLPTRESLKTHAMSKEHAQMLLDKIVPGNWKVTSFKLNCFLCQKVFNSPSDLKSHQMTHKDLQMLMK